jgi:hypothetical protein
MCIVILPRVYRGLGVMCIVMLHMCIENWVRYVSLCCIGCLDDWV